MPIYVPESPVYTPEDCPICGQKPQLVKGDAWDAYGSQFDRYRCPKCNINANCAFFPKDARNWNKLTKAITGSKLFSSISDKGVKCCPICGKEPHFSDEGGLGQYRPQYFCPDCRLYTWAHIFKTEMAARTAWNTLADTISGMKGGRK